MSNPEVRVGKRTEDLRGTEKESTLLSGDRSEFIPTLNNDE